MLRRRCRKNHRNSSFPSPIRRRLDAVKLGVLTALGRQLFMSAYFNHPRAVEYHDQIRHPHGAEPMRHQDGDTAIAACRGGVALEKRMFGLSVQRCGRLIEHQDEWLIAHEAPGQRELLPLAEAHFHPLRPGCAELRIEARDELRDHIFRPGAADGGDYRGFVFEPEHVAKPDGMARAELEAEEVLERPRETRTPFAGANPREVHAIHQYASLVGLVESAEQLHQCAFAGAVLAHNGDYRAGLEFEAYIIEHPALGAGIRE